LRIYLFGAIWYRRHVRRNLAQRRPLLLKPLICTISALPALPLHDVSDLTNPSLWWILSPPCSRHPCHIQTQRPRSWQLAVATSCAVCNSATGQGTLDGCRKWDCRSFEVLIFLSGLDRAFVALQVGSAMAEPATGRRARRAGPWKRRAWQQSNNVGPRVSWISGTYSPGTKIQCEKQIARNEANDGQWRAPMLLRNDGWKAKNDRRGRRGRIRDPNLTDTCTQL